MEGPNGYAIPWKGLSVGTHSFEFTVDRSFFSAFGGELVKDGLAKVAVQAVKSPSGLELRFRITGEVRTECDRCLEELALPVEFEGVLQVKPSPEAVTECDGEVMWVNDADKQIDLAQYIYDSICLSLPIIKVHGTDENGKMLCDPEMLARFSIVSQDEFDRIAARGDQAPLSEKIATTEKTDF